MKILLVDDDPLCIEVLGEFLLSNGHEVESAGDWIGLLGAVGSFPAEVILLDVNLPGVRGDQLIPEIRAMAGAAVKIVLISGIEKGELMRLSMETEADGAFSKGDPEEELERILSRLRGSVPPPAPLSQPTPEAEAEAEPEPEKKRRRTLPTQVPWGDQDDQDSWRPLVLVVDASPTRRNFLKDWLSHRGFQAILVDSGEEAMKRLRNPDDLPELLLTDLDLGSTTGHRLRDQIQADSGLVDVEVIVYADNSGGDPRVVEFAKLERSVARKVRALQSIRRLRASREGLEKPRERP